MKKLNMFTRLPKEDQMLVLDLSSKLPYRLVVEKLALPRDQGGLAMTTSESSLSKFVTRHDRDAIAIEAIGQYASALQVNQQAHGAANFEAILGLAQNRILESLRNGKSIADLDKDFRSLARLQKCFLDDVDYRHKNDHVTDAYLDHIKAVARAGDDAEFIRNDVENDPGAGAVTSEDFREAMTQFDLDVDCAKDLPVSELFPTPTYFRGAARIVASLKLAGRERSYIAHQTRKSASVSVSQQSSGPSALPFPSEISESGAPETPAISHLSPNFVSPNSGNPPK
jgi:hypothetical protein